MSDKRKKSFLTVVPGRGEGDGRPIAELVCLCPEVPDLPHRIGRDVQQLDLLGIATRPATIVSVGFDGVDYASFCSVLRAQSIRHVADIRLLASFRERGFEVKPTFDMFQEQKITYERMLDLCNRFVGDSANKHVVFEKFLAHLTASEEPLRRLRAQIDRGPLLLLGRGKTHEGSERDAVIRALAALDPHFDIIINPCTTPELLTFDRGDKTLPPLAAQRKSAKPVKKPTTKLTAQEKLKL